MRTVMLILFIGFGCTASTVFGQAWECEIKGFYQGVVTPDKSIVYSEETGWNYASKILMAYTPGGVGIFKGPIEVVNRFLVYLPERGSDRELYVELERGCIELLVAPVDSAVIEIDFERGSFLRGLGN